MNLQICTVHGEDLLLRDVSTFLVDNELIRVLYCNGKQQNYPLCNVRWYGPDGPQRDLVCECDACKVERAEQQVLKELGLENS